MHPDRRRDLDAFANFEMANERASARDRSDPTSPAPRLETEVRELIIEPEWFVLYRKSETMNRLIAPALATVCGIATGMHSFNAPLSHDSEHVLLTPMAAVAAFQPELQKQAAEREGQNVQQFQQQHGGAM
jgi:hypothetical protein